jgi:ribosome maturation factor RimP
VLEVTSPGVDRPLTQPRHWRRATGRLVKATLADETVTGRITAATDIDVTLDIDGVERTLLQAEVSKAVVQVEFSRQEADQ